MGAAALCATALGRHPADCDNPRAQQRPWECGGFVLEAAEFLQACLGQQDIIDASKPLLPFLGAAFLLLLGLGRLSNVARLLFGGELDHDSQLDPDTAIAEQTPAAQRFSLVATALAFFYVPAALILGVGLAGEVILGEQTKLVFWLEIVGIALAFVTLALLQASNWMVRDPATGGTLAHRHYDRPVLCTNAALRNRGTNRFEVILVIVAVLGLGGGQVLKPQLNEWLMVGVPDCPPEDQIQEELSLDEGGALGPLPLRWAFGRMPSRSNADLALPGQDQLDVPELRLDGETAALDLGTAPADLMPDVIAPDEAEISVWAQLAIPSPQMEPTIELNRLIDPSLALVRPSQRPRFGAGISPSLPPPDMFGTVTRLTRMTPAVWQVRVHTGIEEFTQCIMERYACDENAVQWSAFVERSRHLEGEELLFAVNQFVNASVQFQSDRTLEEVLDEWATPASLIRQAEGDCEDFALAKFWLLEMLGVDRSDLYIVVVQDLVVRLPHAYLAVRRGSDVLLLDSRTNRLLSPDELDGIVPVVTIGHSASYLHGRPVDDGQPMSFMWEWLRYFG